MEDMEVYALAEASEIERCSLIIQLLKRIEVLEYQVYDLTPKVQ